MKKQIAILIDPGKENIASIREYINHINLANPDFILIGGSQNHAELHEYVSSLKSQCKSPVYLFPGNASQFTPDADAILLLSLISGRNPEFLIGQHVRSALEIVASKIKVIPTGYILVDGGTESAVEKASATAPIDCCDMDKIIRTAVAGELLGFKMIYLEAGSGAEKPVNKEIIHNVRKNISIPLIVGGGINSPERITSALQAGADIIVIGNHLENNISDLQLFTDIVHSF